MVLHWHITPGVKSDSRRRKKGWRVGLGPYSFVNLLSLLFGQPTQRVRILPRAVGLRRCRRGWRLLRLLGALGTAKVCRSRVA